MPPSITRLRVPIRRVGVIDVAPVIVQITDPVVGDFAAAASVGADPVKLLAIA